jgi:protein-S-isoprenylcysteine O-methyltransferase Ste14
MIFRDQHEKSLFPKLFIALSILISILISSYLMFVETQDMIDWFVPYNIDGDLIRIILLLACFVIYFIRLMGTLFIFFQRKMYWGEAIIIANLMPWVFPYVAWIGGNNNRPVGFTELTGVILFLFGSYLNTASEYSRHIWKRKRENQGHLYTEGLFKHIRHVNYLGDVLIFMGLTAVAHQFILLVIPMSMALIFAAILIPLKEQYLRKKYGIEFERYRYRTKKLIPMLY